MLGLATWLDEDSIEVRLSNSALAEAASLHPDTLKTTKPQLRKKGWLEYEPGKHRGDFTLYRALILEGGVSGTPSSEGGAGAIPPSPEKGGPAGDGRGGRSAKEGGVGQLADQREGDRKLSPLAKPQAKVSRAVRDVIRAAVPNVTDEETETYALAIIDQRHPDNLERYLRAFPASRIAEGIMAIRQPNDVALVAGVGRQVAPGRPTDTQFRVLCPRCSRPGHGADACPDRNQMSAPEQPPRPKLAVVETPCAAGEKCQRARTPLPDGQLHHPVCKELFNLRAAMPIAASAMHQDGGIPA